MNNEMIPISLEALTEYISAQERIRILKDFVEQSDSRYIEIDDVCRILNIKKQTAPTAG